MLFTALSSPRRLGFLAVLISVVVILFLQLGQGGSRYLPQHPIIQGGGGGGKTVANSGASKGEDAAGGDVNHLHEPSVVPGHSHEPSAVPGHGDESSESKPQTGATKDTHPTPSTLDSTTTRESAWTTQSAAKPATATSTPSASGPVRESYDKLQEKFQGLLKNWKRPVVGDHWPPYDWYGNKDYDPNLWEGFEWNNDFYIQNGISGPKEDHFNKEVQRYRPYPDYSSMTWKNLWKGEFVSCVGPRGGRLNESSEDAIAAYTAPHEGFPQPAVGDAEVVGIDIKRCFDRYHRYGPYGFGQEGAERVGEWARPVSKPDWGGIQWGQLQDRCLIDNGNRYAEELEGPPELAPSAKLPADANKTPDPPPLNPTRTYHPRTAVLIRTWEGYEYTENDIQAIRALITELNLFSGAEYHVFLFVNIKDVKADIYGNKKVRDDLVRQNVPKEFEDITILWNEWVFQQWYPDVKDWQVYWHQFMPLQWFSKTHPEFDYVWNWETDARYTGNHYQFLEAVAKFSKKMPRKYLWERNSRFYFPSAHGSYEQWLNETDATIEKAMAEDSLKPVWGAQPYNSSSQQPIGPVPPQTMESDDFDWGVNEEADLITLQPIWDPAYTEWTMRNKIWNFVPGVRPHFSQADPLDESFTHAEFPNIPRRAYINTLSRFSKHLLHAMHMENTAGRTMQAEMWPATVALHHGLKAVYAPHPIWTDRRWPAWYMDAVFNADGNRSARWGAQADSIYNHDREHNFAGWSWYYASDFPRLLYRRWLGWSASAGSAAHVPNNPLRVLGGKAFEEETHNIEFPAPLADGSQAAPAGGESFGGRSVAVGGKGRMCLPPMLLHPVKGVKEDAPQDS